MGGGDEFLGIHRPGGHQGISSAGIKLAEDIIDQQQWRTTPRLQKQATLGQLQGQSQGPLLAFAGKFGGRETIDGQGRVGDP